MLTALRAGKVPHPFFYERKGYEGLGLPGLVENPVEAGL